MEALHKSVQEAVVRFSEELYALAPDQGRAFKTVQHRIQAGTDAYVPFKILLEATLHENNEEGEEALGPREKIKAGIVMRVLWERSSRYDPKRDGPRLYAWVHAGKPLGLAWLDWEAIKLGGEQVQHLSQGHMWQILKRFPSQQALADEVGCSQDQISRYVRYGLPSRMNAQVRARLVALAEQFGIRISLEEPSPEEAE